MQNKLIDELMSYVDSKGRHILWRKRNVLSIRKKVFNSRDFIDSTIARKVIDATSFLPKCTKLEYRVKAIMQGITSYSKCIVCGENACISKSISFKDPFFTRFCFKSSCRMSFMSKSRITTDESRKNHSISMLKYKRKLDEAYANIIELFEHNEYELFSYEDAVKYANECIASQYRNGQFIKHHDILNNEDIICSVIFYTQFVKFNYEKSGFGILSLPERLYCLVNSISQRPICRFCAGEVKFIDIKHGYYESCADCREEKRRLTIGRPTYADVLESINKSGYEIVDAPNGKISGKKSHLVVKCNRCGRTTKIALHCGTMFTRVMGKGLCKNCDKYSSNDERDVRDVVKAVLGLDEVVEFNDHNVIAPYELDIVVPRLKVAIEFNGIYWHNDSVVKKNYHQTKTMLCEKVGYKLVHIFEDKWHLNKKLCIGILRRALKRSRVIDAHDCRINISRHTLDIGNFMHKYTFGYASSNNSTFAEFFFKSHRIACVEFYSRGKKTFVKNIAQLNSFEVSGLVEAACRHLDIEDVAFEVSHDFYSAKDFNNAFSFKKYKPSVGKWLFHSKAVDISCIKKDPSKHLKTYDASKLFEDNLRANGYWRIYDSGTILFEKHFKSKP